MAAKARLAAVGQAAHACRLTFHGTMSNVQTWSTSFWFNYAAGTSTPSAVTAAASLAGSDELENFIETFWGLLQNKMAPFTNYLTWDVTCYGESGGDPVTATAANPQGLTGTATVTHPAEVAVVASLITHSAGASFRGRSYLPLTGIILPSTGIIDTTTTQALATYVANLLSSINGHQFLQSEDLYFNLQAAVNSVQLGVLTPITSVRVDGRYDAQRRREDKLISPYSSVNLH